ncbi:MAG: hypothetical protein AAF420_10270, partial [Pseudomonadota bacterium]
FLETAPKSTYKEDFKTLDTFIDHIGVRPATIEHCENQTLGLRCFVHKFIDKSYKENLVDKAGLDYSVVTAENTLVYGPSGARGAILFLPGYGGWWNNRPNNPPLLSTPYVPQFLESLNKNRWDVARINFDYFSRIMIDVAAKPDKSNSDYLARALREIVNRYRNRGYANIVLAGHSRGGCEAMHAAAAHHNLNLDALILTEATCLGPYVNRAGEVREGYRERQLKDLGSRLSDLDVEKLIYVKFAGSDWFPNITAKDIEVEFESYPGQTMIIADPDGYRGHGASGSWRFNYQFGECIRQFLTSELAMLDECLAPTPATERREGWLLLEHLPKRARPISGTELRELTQGGVMCGYDIEQQRIMENSGCIEFRETERLTTQLNDYQAYSTTNHARAEYRENGYCKFDGFGAQTTNRTCLQTYAVDDLIVFYSEGGQQLWWQQLVPNRRLRNTDFRCTSDSTEFSCTPFSLD